MPVADEYTRDRFAWLDSVAADHRKVGALAARVGYWISHHVSRKEGCAWPSQPLLGRLVGVTERAVRNAIKELEEAGHIRVAAPNKKGGSNRYFLIQQPRNESSAVEQPTPEPQFRASTPNPGTKLPQPRNESSATPGTAVPTNQLNEPTEETTDGYISQPTLFADEKKLAKEAPRRQESIDPAFEQFWAQYPLRKAKESARASYIKAVKSGVLPDDILAGAMRYAAERQSQDPRFTKHASTWLRGGCWADEPDGPAPAAAQTWPSQQSATQRILQREFERRRSAEGE
jgi:biotin operon repressor